MEVRKHRVLALFAVLALAACSGDSGAKGEKGDPGAKGDTGVQGPTGPQGPQGEPPLATTEACGGCHAATLAETHALSDQLGVKVTVPTNPVTVSGTDVIVKFNVKVNDVARFDFIYKAADLRNHNEDAYWVYDVAQQAGVRTKFGTKPTDATYWTIASSQSGDYTATIKGMTLPLAAGTTFMLSIMNASGVTATAVATYGTPAHDVVSNQACIHCHGNLIWKDAAHDVTFPQGVGPCVVCHNRAGSADPRLPGAGTGLMGIVHGIHNSANMPDGEYVFTWTNGNKFPFKKGFPGNMNNCATCHDSDARLAQVKDAPVSYALCISCHDDWDGFANTKAGAPLDFHRNYDATTVVTACATCHNGSTAPATLSDFHNGSVTERAGLIWDGADQSVVLGAAIKLDITGVAVNGTNLEITWTAKNPKDGTAYNACNQDFAQGPVFFGYSPGSGTEGCTNTAKGCDSSFSILRSYALANDWVNDNLTGSSSPGQPAGSTTLKASNTTCDASYVAKTVVPIQSTAATRGIVALQGKPQVKFGPSGTIIWVRAQTPTREFVVSTGALPAEQRRQLVSIDKCIACHLGTVYQHGGTRVDSIELCVMCHNPAASEQNRRVDIGIGEANSYDGKSGDSYDLRYMVHAIHSAGETQKPLVYYRTNGIFFFGSPEALPANWPPKATPAECVTCFDSQDGVLTYCPVVGSTTSGNKYELNSDGTCKNDVASTNGTWRAHRVIAVHYPRPLRDCAACHENGTEKKLPDPTKAVAVTFEAGVAPWNNLTDDLLIGPSTAACMSCHQSGDDLNQLYLRKHAYDNSWWPSKFDNGRQTLLDAVGALLSDEDVP